MIYRLKLIVLIGLLLFSAGCGNDQYSAERQYWLAQKNAEKIFNNPYASPPRQLERAVAKFNKFIQSYPETNMAILARLNIARLYIIKEEYQKGIDYLKGMMNRYKDAGQVYAEALFLTGYAYEAQEKWSQALEEYEKIIRVYPVTSRGMGMPLYVVQHYKAKYQPDKMIAALKEAVSHYQGLAEKYANTPFGVQVVNKFLGRAQKMLKEAGGR